VQQGDSDLHPRLLPLARWDFIDTAVNYQDGQSEQWLGEWMESRGVRDQMVVATKFTTNYKVHLKQEGCITSNFGGNSTKCLHLAVEESLRNLRTSYIDILYVHWWDHATSAREIMLSLNTLLNQGKVLYLGASDMPAWFVAKCNEFARCNGLRGFVVYQGEWSAASRSFESDILSLCAEEGMGIAPWGALGGGRFKTQAQKDIGGGRKHLRENKNAEAVAIGMEALAKRKGTALTSVALAYVLHKAPYVFPICGGRSLEQLKENIEAVGLDSDEGDMEEIESAAPFELGFPFNLI
jgi:aryl-alcohol dehydrogenase-like predicted oxidoreductase